MRKRGAPGRQDGAGATRACDYAGYNPAAPQPGSPSAAPFAGPYSVRAYWTQADRHGHTPLQGPACGWRSPACPFVLRPGCMSGPGLLWPFPLVVALDSGMGGRRTSVHTNSTACTTGHFRPHVRLQRARAGSQGGPLALACFEREALHAESSPWPTVKRTCRRKVFCSVGGRTCVASHAPCLQPMPLHRHTFELQREMFKCCAQQHRQLLQHRRRVASGVSAAVQRARQESGHAAPTLLGRVRCAAHDTSPPLHACTERVRLCSCVQHLIAC
jgi:hypothetical protein